MGKTQTAARQLSLLQLWTEYLDYKRPILKASTINNLENTVTGYLKKSGVTSPYDALSLRKWLLDNTTQGMTKRILTNVNAAFKWGIRHRRVKGDSPYEGMSAELKHQWELNSEPNAFTPEEKAAVLEAFATNERRREVRGLKGNPYQHYLPFVRFLFLTGCRPHEAIGLRWGDVAADFSRITFDGGIFRLPNGGIIRQKGSKNNRRRSFPCNDELKAFLRELKPDRVTSTELVFLSPRGKVINYGNFLANAWHKTVDPIKPETTPYSCRDTFISEQVLAGVPLAVVGKWVDNSATVIERSYFDFANLSQFTPK